ncbi:pentatricopeptide repeat-containing protein At3g21470 isoform X1 [Cannabis sativa]|uniref:pentatricopeptide repeat-containing protein At3g21470 isoform X1 n=1 Tax=Cannabis sativa TaxID=3483 RepID=UPI0029C9E446|nr:pentatricopeptide repeat-containing protein At3g21470 isoform X1 [Cannabis sativa]
MRRRIRPKLPQNFTTYNQIYAFSNNAGPPNWSSLIQTHISQGSPKQALLIYNQIRTQGIYILGLVPQILKACSSLCFLNYGKAVHGESIKSGVYSDLLIGTSMVDTYAKCRKIIDAQKVFDEMPERNVVTWNAMIGGYLKNGDIGSASLLFDKMSERNSVTWIEMIDGFAKCGDIVSARQFFDCVPMELKNLVTWTVMVDGYSSNGDMEAAKEVFELMPKRNFFAWSSMISGYCKKGDVKNAEAIFERIPVRNLVNWNSMISGYVQNGLSREALKAFVKMKAEGFKPDEVTIVSVLSACAQLGLMDFGREIHHMIVNKHVNCNLFVISALVDMYAKCGDLNNARLIFEGMMQRNTACWNAMISGFAVHGQCKEALELFARMERSNEKPDTITFLSVLSACGHGGFVDEGIEILSKMEKYGVATNIKHYGCLVDLLGRAGRLKEAYDLIKTMPMEPNDTVWGAILGACRTHLDMEMAEEVVKEINTLSSSTGSSQNPHYVVLSNIYAASERWEKAERLRVMMVNEGLEKTPGRSSFMPSGS